MEKKRNKGFKVFLRIFGSILVVFAILFVVLIISMGSSMKKMQAIENVDIATVADGVYRGSTDSLLVKVDVEVTVKDHQIVKIDLLKHQNGKGTPAEAIINTIIYDNSTDVDAISGATMSSSAIKGAINLALKQGISGE